MDVTTRIRSYFAKVIAMPVQDDDDIFALGLVNSLFAMQLLAFVEGEFAIVAEREDLNIANFCTIGALTRFVEAKLGGAAPPAAGHGPPAH
jgi:acyl carrier protein